jgi:hypothetical protein
MLRRLMSWCVPDSALALRADEPEVANVELALAPYEHEAASADARFSLRVVTNS